MISKFSPVVLLSRVLSVLAYDDGGPSKEFTEAISDVYNLDSVMKRSHHSNAKAPETQPSVDEDNDSRQPGKLCPLLFNET